MDRDIKGTFIKYVALNVLGMAGLSCYILADTFFIARAMGAEGLAALNFSISIYSIIHGIGLMVGIGGATRFCILKARCRHKRADIAFAESFRLGLSAGTILAGIGLFASYQLASMLGADSSTLPMTTTYLRTILCFAPFFISNNILIAFARNDSAPRLSMAAMLAGSLSNIILDYIFIFPLDMGMFGAAFATGLAPIISMGILSFHFFKRKNNFVFMSRKVSFSSVLDILTLGLSAFVTELSSAVALITFNLVILGLKGNSGVAAYGIVANLALVAISIFTGIAQGSQPLVSCGHGANDRKVTQKIRRYALVTSLFAAFVIYFGTFVYSEGIVTLFNSQNDPVIAEMAERGIRLYFIGFFFAGINVTAAMFFSACENSGFAFIISIARGCIVIVPLLIVLSRLTGMTGVWLSFVITEFFVTLVALYMAGSKKRYLSH